MKQLFSLGTLTQVIRHCACRFPVTVGFIIALTVYMLALTWADDKLLPNNVEVSVSYYLAVGTLLTTVLQLWREEVKSKRALIITNIVAHTALLADAAYIYTVYNNGGMEVFLAHAAVVTALTLCMFILPFFRERDDIASWNFTARLIGSAASSYFIGCIMCGGLCLLTTAVGQLFGLDLHEEWLQTWCILFLFALPSLLFIGRIPAEGDKHDRMPVVSPFLNKSIRYLLLPLLGCYLLVLYLYLAKILVEWQLPDGWVSKLVSVLTFGSIGVILGLYPSIHQGTSRTDRRVTGILPLTILPLLVLMTVGIVRRLNDYGITVNRLYILTLNIWYYIVCIGLFVTRARRVWWITASFAALFMLTSVLPVNIASYTRNWLYERVETVIKDNYKEKLPMSEVDYYNLVARLPYEEAWQLNSRLEYLDWELRDKTINALVPDTISWWEARNCIEDNRKDGKANTTSKSLYYHSKVGDGIFDEIALDGRYTSMLSYNNTPVEVTRSKNKPLLIPIRKGALSASPIDTLEIKMEDIRKWSALNNYTPRAIPCRREGNNFILTYFILQGMRDSDTLTFTYSGHYFIQQQTKTDNNE